MHMSWQVTKYSGSVRFRKINWKCETKGLVTPSKRDWLPYKPRGRRLILGASGPSKQGSRTSIPQHFWAVRSLDSQDRLVWNTKTVRFAPRGEFILYKCCSSLFLKSHFRVKVTLTSFVCVKWNPNEQREKQRLTPPKLLPEGILTFHSWVQRPIICMYICTLSKDEWLHHFLR